MAASAMPDHPSIERRSQSNARERVCRDSGEQFFNFIEAPASRDVGTVCHINDVINQRDEVLINQRM